MGLIALASLLVLLLTAAIALTGTVVSAYRSRAVPLYWIAALALAVLLPIALHQPPARRSGSEYAALGQLIAAAFSRTNATVVIGTWLATALSFVPNDIVRVASAATWGFLSLFVVRVVLSF